MTVVEVSVYLEDEEQEYSRASWIRLMDAVRSALENRAPQGWDTLPIREYHADDNFRCVLFEGYMQDYLLKGLYASLQGYLKDLLMEQTPLSMTVRHQAVDDATVITAEQIKKKNE